MNVINVNDKKLYFNIKRCDSKVEKDYNLTCASDKEISAKYGDKLYIETVYQQNDVIPSNYKDPITPIFYFDSVGIKIEKHQALYRRLYYSTAQITTDRGLIFPEKNIKDMFKFSKLKDNIEPHTSNFLLTMRIIINRTKIFYYRSYIKIQDVLAKLGGLMSVVYEVTITIYELYTEHSFKIFLYDKLFRLEIEEDSTNEPSKEVVQENILKLNNDKSSLNLQNKGNEINLSKEIEIGDLSKKPNISNTSNINPNTQEKFKDPMPLGGPLYKNKLKKFTSFNPELSKLMEYKRKIAAETKITLTQRLYYKCCCFEEDLEKYKNMRVGKIKYELMKAADNYIQENSSITNMWGKFSHLRLIEKLILNESQCYMLHNRRRQLIRNQDMKLQVVKELEKEKDEKLMKQLIEYLSERTTEKKLSEVDRVLLQYIHPNLRNEITQFIQL